MTISFSLIGALGVPGAAIVAFVYRRFRRTGINEIEPFARYVTQGLKYYVGRWVRRQLASELTLRQYARVHLRSTATEMVVPATFPVTLRVDDVFVPLLLRGPTGGIVEYRDLVDRSSSRIVVLGEPGSGKSSLMKRTFRDACRRANSNPRTAALPLLFELRKLPKDRLESLTPDALFECCVTSLTTTAAFKAKHAVEHFQHGAGYLVLLDGLDEVPSDYSTKVTETISELAHQLALSSPRSSLIVSTRTQHYLSLHDRVFRETFQVLSLRPFSAADVYRFLLKWPFDTNRKQNITRLFSRIRQLPSLTEMCTNPLALSMFVARDQQTGGATSPETRSQFYSSLVAELLVNRRLRREESPVGRQRLQQLREQILGAVCLGHLLDSDEAPNSVGQARLVAAIEGAGTDAEESRDALSNLAVDTGLFSAEREGETYRFLHLTLCEFLAAREVVNLGSAGWALIAARLAGPLSAGSGDGGDWNARLREVVAFACGLAPRSLCQEILADLAAGADRGLVLRAAIEAQSYGNTVVLASILDEAESLASIGPDRWDLAWFARLRWLIAVQRDIAGGSRDELGTTVSDVVPTPASYLVGLIDTHGAEELLLATLARNDADGAVAIAETSGRSALMDAVAGATDDFGVLLGILSRCEAGRTDWKHALIHCALTQPNIADVLRSSASEHSDGPPQGGWRRSFITGGSVYGELLDDVLSEPNGWRESDRDLFDKLAQVRPPRSLGKTLIRSRAIELGAPLAVSAAAVATVVALGQREGNVPITVGTVILGLMMILTLLLRMYNYGASVASVEIRVGAIALTVDQRAETKKDDSLLRSGTLKAGAASDHITRPWRGPILEEALSLGRFQFTASDTPTERPEPDTWQPHGLQRIVWGVRKQDVAALHAARRFREAKLEATATTALSNN